MNRLTKAFPFGSELPQQNTSVDGPSFNMPLQDWGPRAMMSNLSCLEQIIHQLQELVQAIANLRSQVSTIQEELVGTVAYHSWFWIELSIAGHKSVPHFNFAAANVGNKMEIIGLFGSNCKLRKALLEKQTRIEGV